MTQTSPLPTELELFKEGLKLVSVTFGINIYTDVSFYDCAASVLESLRLFREHAPEEALKYHATETMREHKPVTKRALGMLPTWLKPDAPRKHYISLDLKSGDQYQDAPDYKYEVWAEPASPQANIISMAFPAAWGSERTAAMLELVVALGNTIQFKAGLAGYSLECSRYNKQASERHAWSKSMRHPGLDVVRLPIDARAAQGEAIRGVGWLTLVGSAFLEKLGGTVQVRRRLSAAINLIEVRHGIVIQAGPVPLAGDVNRADTLPLYREVYALLATFIGTAGKQSMAFQLAMDYVERTQAWHARLTQ
jgi:hypothetical protein